MYTCINRYRNWSFNKRVRGRVKDLGTGLKTWGAGLKTWGQG